MRCILVFYARRIATIIAAIIVVMIVSARYYEGKLVAVCLRLLVDMLNLLFYGYMGRTFNNFII